MVLVFDKVDPINDDKPNTFVLPEKLGKAPDRQVELHSAHAWVNEQIRHHFHDKIVFVLIDLPLVGTLSKYLPKLVLVVNMAHFLYKLPCTELALDVKKDGLYLLSFRDLH